MKKLITLFTLIAVFGFANTIFAQKGTGKTDTNKEIISPKFTCNQVVMTLFGNVSFKTDKFEFVNAGKVVYDEKTKKLTVYNCKAFSIIGKTVVKNPDFEVNFFEYTLGDDTVYVL
jgi:hypothetical protein